MKYVAALMVSAGCVVTGLFVGEFLATKIDPEWKPIYRGRDVQVSMPDNVQPR